MIDSKSISNWEDFVYALKIKFGPSEYEDPVGTFTKLKQTGTIKEYQSQFEAFSNQIKGLTKNFKISTFINGLRDDLMIMVTIFKPLTLLATFGLAKLQEEKVNMRNKGLTKDIIHPFPL